jgi:PTS system ascorbate-specific IIA component
MHAFPEKATAIAALDVSPDVSIDEVETQARDLLASTHFEQAVVFTDVFGATPCNVAERLAADDRVRVVAGVNVPMLWRTLCYGDESLDSMVARAVAGATQGVMQVVPARTADEIVRTCR